MLGAVGLPLAGALQLVAAASNGTAATVGVSRRARPRRRARSPGCARAAPSTLKIPRMHGKWHFSVVTHGQAYCAGTLQRHVLAATCSGYCPGVAQAKEVYDLTSTPSAMGLPFGEAVLMVSALLMRHCICDQTALACVRCRQPSLDTTRQPTWHTAKRCRPG